MKQRLPLIYRMIQGAIGKRFVIKHYKYGVIKTRYPDMTNIPASEAQKARIRLFRLAVRYAQSVYANPVLKEKKRKLLRRPKRLFQALMKEWFRIRAERSFHNARRLRIWRNHVKIDTNVKLDLYRFVTERSLYKHQFAIICMQLE